MRVAGNTLRDTGIAAAPLVTVAVTGLSTTAEP
jgi:hypothetical protein